MNYEYTIQQKKLIENRLFFPYVDVYVLRNKIELIYINRLKYHGEWYLYPTSHTIVKDSIENSIIDAIKSIVLHAYEAGRDSSTVIKPHYKDPIQLD